MNTVLVTGGAGYIGSHTTLELLNKDYRVIVVDNLSNSRETALQRVEKLTGKKISFHKTDLRDKISLDRIFTSYPDLDAVIHFAGYKAVGESVEIPLAYYDNNITGTLCLCHVMQDHGIRNLVFSSSCTVYGAPSEVPVTEDAQVIATNPYGRTKLFIEEILRDLNRSDNRWNISLLRYFNPTGAHESGLIGEDPRDIPNNLVPYISQVAVGKLEKLSVFGNDYPTRDGTGIRDYIHVVDLARGHLKALEKLQDDPGLMVHNLGTGHGYSVLEVIEAFEEASGQKIPFGFAPRRPGDIAETYADPTKAEKELGWKAERDLKEMCRDVWRWQSHNPEGY